MPSIISDARLDLLVNSKRVEKENEGNRTQSGGGNACHCASIVSHNIVIDTVYYAVYSIYDIAESTEPTIRDGETKIPKEHPVDKG